MRLQTTILVTGKGGVGKTTVATGLAEHFAKSDGACLYIEFGDGESGGRSLSKGSNVTHRFVEPADAIERAVSGMLGSSLLGKLFTGNFAMRPMLRAAPALRELAMLECVRLFSEEFERDNGGSKHVVVDMPATGHGLSWMKIPAQMRELFKSGPLYELASRVATRLASPETTSVVVVTLPEKLVVSETLELLEKLELEVKLPPALLVVNRYPGPVSPDALVELDALLLEHPETAADVAVAREMLVARDEACREVREATAGRAAVVWLPAFSPEPTSIQIGETLSREPSLRA